MKPNRMISNFQVSIWASIVLATVQICYAKDRVSINTDPPGATVEIDGMVVGKTPYQFEVPGGYLTVQKVFLGNCFASKCTCDYC